MLRAARRLRRRFFGPGPHEARVFFTPGLIALATIAVWAVVAARVLPAMAVGPADLPYMFASPGHVISLRTGTILLAAVLLGFYALLVTGWLVEAWRFGWAAYRPWRIVGGVWGTILFAASLYLGYTALSSPSAGELVAKAKADLATPQWRRALPAFRFGLPGTRDAALQHLGSSDEYVRFVAAAMLWNRGDHSPRVARTLLATVETVRAIPSDSRRQALSQAQRDRLTGGVALVTYGYTSGIVRLAPPALSEPSDLWRSWDRSAPRIREAAGR